MKKILFVWEHISPIAQDGNFDATNLKRTLLGGGEVSLINLTQYLGKQASISQDLLVIYKNELEYPQFNHVYTVESIYKPGGFTRLKLLFKVVARLRKLINAYDVIIINDEPFLSIVFFVLKIWGLKPRLIFWSHLSKSYFKSNSRFLSRQVNYLMLKHFADKVVCVTDYARKSMVEFLKRKQDNIVVIYNIVGDNISRPTKIVNPKELTDILAVSRLSKEKGIEVLINAIGIIVNRCNVKDIHLTICGDGVEYKNLAQMVVRLKLDAYVTFAGYQDDLTKYYTDGDIFVSSSYTEVFSLVVLEAMQYGKAIVSTNTGAAEVLGYGKCGLIVDCGDSEQLADGILKLKNDKELARQLIANSTNELQKFAPEAIVLNWLSII